MRVQKDLNNYDTDTNQFQGAFNGSEQISATRYSPLLLRFILNG